MGMKAVVVSVCGRAWTAGSLVSTWRDGELSGWRDSRTVVVERGRNVYGGVQLVSDSTEVSPRRHSVARHSAINTL